MNSRQDNKQEPSDKINIHQRKQLWENSYPTWKFVWESFYLFCTLCLWIVQIYRTIQYHSGPFPTVLGFIAAQFLVDFVSGLLHWGCDTWGKFETPIVGPTLIRSFRMHHVDPQDITTHGFIETNAASCYPMPIFILFGMWLAGPSFIAQFYNWMIIFGVVLGVMTNQFHKYAHMVHTKPHPVIVFLQKAGLIISHEKHHIHHQGQFNSSYCIINGWMNPILEKIDFWRKTENLITRWTGAEPRADDEFWRRCKEQ